MDPNELKKLSERIYKQIQPRVLETQTDLTPFTIERSPEDNKPRRTYTQNWPAYNQAKTNEKVMSMDILDELLGYIPFPKRRPGAGRKGFKIPDKIRYLAYMSYDLKSSRKCVSDLKDSKKRGANRKIVHFNTLLKWLNDSSLTDYLKHLILVSGWPLRQYEQDFAVDSSGFSTTVYGRWFDIRLGSYSEKKRFIKAHICCGVKTNIITAVNITASYHHDGPEFESLVKDTSRIYDIREVSADKAYSSRKNLDMVHQLGGVPYIPFKSNSRMRKRGSMTWRKMWSLYVSDPVEFNKHYHKRSNSETTFYMTKTNLGRGLKTKKDTAQVNELLVKCLCHNLTVLVQESIELGIILDYQKCADIEIAHKSR